MLKTIDILLGVSVVMLIISMAVTVLTQFITNLLASRGNNLRAGLADLLQQIDPRLPRAIVEGIATSVLMHPLIRSQTLTRWHLGTTIHREEFTKLLMDLAAGNAPDDLLEGLGREARTALTTLLANNGISEPAQTLDRVRATALQLELANPALATDARQAIALMTEARSKLVAKINSWFDQTIDRVSDRFTQNARVVTGVCSLLLAFAIQLDTIGLINKLSVDEKFREALVSQAIASAALPAAVPAPTLPPAPSAPIHAPPAPDGAAAVPADAGSTQRISLELSPEQRADLDNLMTLGIIRIARSYSQWQARWSDLSIPLLDWKILGNGAAGAKLVPAMPSDVSVVGVLLSALLLSLGAPFWYNALNQLLRLRSVISSNDDAQRQIRQTTQVPPEQPAAAPPAAPPDGEVRGSEMQNSEERKSEEEKSEREIGAGKKPG